MHSILTRRIPLAALVVIGAASISAAQSLSAAIVGCDEVGCPVKDGSIGADDGAIPDTECKLIDETFNEIGLARIPTAGSADAGAGALAGISWVQGNSVTDAGNDARYPTQRVLRRNWYFGTPAGFGLGSGARACAAFFHKSAAEFPEGNTETAQGTCEQAMDPACVQALVRRARAIQVGDGDGDDVCEKLEEDLLENFDAECREVASSPYWRNVTVRPIVGGSAPAVILSSDNITSNCWPITPKQDDLAFIESREQSTDDFGRDVLEKFFYGVTPILTVFYGGRDAAISETTAQMTCLKTMGPSPASNRTDDDDDDDDGDDDNVEGAATFINGSAATTLLVAVLAVLSSIVL